MTYQKIINFGPGDPDFATPPHIKEAAIKAIEEDYSHYCFGPGLPELRAAAARYFRMRTGVKVETGEILFSIGSSMAIYAALLNILKPGDEGVFIEPSFSPVAEMMQLCNSKVVRVPLKEENGFHLDINDLRRSVTEKTEVIYICNPNNPTGTVHTREELSGLAEVANDIDAFVVSDEVYNRFVWDDHIWTPLITMDGMRERGIHVFSCSKSFAMTGWRLGFFVATEKFVSETAQKMQPFIIPSFIQKAGVAAYSGPFDDTEIMEKEYYKRLKFASSRLDKLKGWICPMPEGTLYLWANVRESGLTDAEVAEALKEKAKVIVGARGNGYLRLSMTRPTEEVEEGIKRIEEVWESIIKK